VTKDANLVCPKCYSELKPNTQAEKLTCRNCCTSYPVVCGVPLLIPNTSAVKKEKPSAQLVTDLAGLIGPNLNDDFKAQLSDLFSYDISFSDLGLQIESDQFLDRVRASGFPLAERYPDQAKSTSIGHVSLGKLSKIEDVLLELKPVLIPHAVKAGEAFTMQVRVKNNSTKVIGAFEPLRVKLSSVARLGDEVVEGPRNDFLIDLKPGMEVSMPLVLQAPKRAGTAQFRVMPLIENLAWIENCALEVEIDTVLKTDPLHVDYVRNDVLRSYVDDHKHAVSILDKWLKAQKRKNQVIVEIGGNASPFIGHLSGALYNVDVDAFGLAFGRLRDIAGGTTSVQHLVADGMDLPFCDGSVDCIAMFATFHHFPDPRSFLQALKRKLSPKGFIALLCEPIGHVFRATVPDEYKGELAKGVNEQSFEFWEYREFAARAGLKIKDMVVDTGSIKLMLAAE
jgi:uncharacterized protein YbaR (Trm112 family)